MKNIEKKKCLQGLKRQNKLFVNRICVKKISLYFKKQMFAEANNLKKKVCMKIMVRPKLPNSVI